MPLPHPTRPTCYPKHSLQPARRTSSRQGWPSETEKERTSICYSRTQRLQCGTCRNTSASDRTQDQYSGQYDAIVVRFITQSIGPGGSKSPPPSAATSSPRVFASSPPRMARRLKWPAALLSVATRDIEIVI